MTTGFPREDNLQTEACAAQVSQQHRIQGSLQLQHVQQYTI